MTTPRAGIDGSSATESLNVLMRNEQTAAMAYHKVLERLGDEAPAEPATCQSSHDRRAVLLAEHITLAGGTPVSGGGDWNAFAQVIDDRAPWLSTHTLYATLEEGEDQALTAYRAAVDRLDAQGLLLVRRELLPEQVRTHGLMRSLRLSRG